MAEFAGGGPGGLSAILPPDPSRRCAAPRVEDETVLSLLSKTGAGRLGDGGSAYIDLY